MAGRAVAEMAWACSGAAWANCEVISSATADIGAMAHDTQTAWRQLAPLLMLPRPTPTALASRRATTRASTARATVPLHEAWAATVETSTNISRVSSDEAVPSWRGQAQGRWCSCLSSMPPSSAASGAEPPRCAAIAVAAAISASIRMEVFSLVGLISCSARRIARHSRAATATDTPSTTSTGVMSCHSEAEGRAKISALALPRVSAYSVDSVARAMARSVTGPAARVSLTTRVSTTGEAAMAISASGVAVVGGSCSQTRA